LENDLYVSRQLLVVGCAFQALRYTVDSGNVELIRGSTERVSLPILKPKFNDDGSIVCRAAGAVSLPEKRTFTQYIANALIFELDAVDSYSETSPKVLEFQLLRADFTSALGNTNWYIDSKYHLDGQEFNVSTIYHGRSSYVAIKACNNVAVYFSKAVPQHISQVFEQPAFRDALKIEENGTNNASDAATRLKALDELLRKGLITYEEYTAQKARILESI
jgi:hypothetical protein